MAYELDLPRDVHTDLNEFLDGFSHVTRLEAHAAVVSEFLKLTVNPKLGASIYFGGPAERRLFYRFRVTVSGDSYDLQIAYVVNDASKVITVHGFGVVDSDPN
jgi:hypothetical protein